MLLVSCTSSQNETMTSDPQEVSNPQTDVSNVADIVDTPLLTAS